MASNTNPAAKNEACNCYKAIYLWIGDMIDTFIGGLKPQLVTQLKKEFPEHKEKNPSFKRALRSEKKFNLALPVASGDNPVAVVEETKHEEGMDMYDIVAAKNVLSKFGDDWIESVKALTVWSKKKV